MNSENSQNNDLKHGQRHRRIIVSPPPNDRIMGAYAIDNPTGSFRNLTCGCV